MPRSCRGKVTGGEACDAAGFSASRRPSIKPQLVLTGIHNTRPVEIGEHRDHALSGTLHGAHLVSRVLAAEHVEGTSRQRQALHFLVLTAQQAGNAIIVLVVIGLVLYLIENYIPMSPPIKTVLRVVVVLALCVWLLNAFGIVNTPMRLK